MSYAETGKFEIAADGVDPKLVPKRKLRTGAEMPAIGLGTFGSDRFTPAEVASAVIGAAEVGYRHFDCVITSYSIHYTKLYEDPHLQKRM